MPAALAASILAIVLALGAGSGAAVAQTPEDNLRKLIEAKMPGERVREIRRTPLPGVYEVAFGNRLFYTDEGLNYLIVGQIIESATNRNLTDQRLRQLTAIDVKQLPLDAAIKTVKGDGKRTLYVFSDPLCPFCSQLEQELQKVTNVTVYTFLTPVDQMRPGSRNRALEIWCATDRSRAWDDWMLSGKEPANASASCDFPKDKILALGKSLNVQATPMSFVTNGKRLQGAVSKEAIEAAFAGR
jgi:thiol:disulfide interchange protein DsbC